MHGIRDATAEPLYPGRFPICPVVLASLMNNSQSIKMQAVLHSTSLTSLLHAHHKPLTDGSESRTSHSASDLTLQHSWDPETSHIRLAKIQSKVFFQMALELCNRQRPFSLRQQQEATAPNCT